MTGRSRRTILCGTAGLLALSAGCLDEAGVSDDGTGNGDAPDPNGDDVGAGGNGSENDDENESTGATDGATIESVPFSYPAGPDSGPDVALLLDADEVSDWIDDRDVASEQVAEFVDGIDFESTVLVRVEADAPNPCHELALEGYELEGEEDETGGDEGTADSAETDAALELETAVVDDAEEGLGCAQVETVVGRLVRAPITDESGVSVTIVDRHGDEQTIDVEADSASESTSGGENESDA